MTKTTMLAFLLLASCGGTMETERCMHPDGTYMVTATRTSGNCGEGFLIPEPVEFHDGWAARLHGVSCSSAPTPFVVDECDRGTWSIVCLGPGPTTTTYAGALFCVTPNCDAIEGVEHVAEAGGCEGTLEIRGARRDPDAGPNTR